MDVISDAWDPLAFLLKNGVPNEDWFTKFDHSEISALIEKINSAAEKSVINNLNDEVIVRLLQTTVTIARRLLEESKPNSLYHGSSVAVTGELLKGIPINDGRDLLVRPPSASSSPREDGYVSEDRSSDKVPTEVDSSLHRAQTEGDLCSINASDNYIKLWSTKGSSLIINENSNHDHYRSTSEIFNDFEADHPADMMISENERQIIVALKGGLGPLGIKVESSEDENGLIVQDIVPGGRIDRDGRIEIGDRITGVNGTSLTDSERAEDMFKKYLSAPIISIKIIRKKKPSSTCCSSPSDSSLYSQVKNRPALFKSASCRTLGNSGESDANKVKFRRSSTSSSDDKHSGSNFVRNGPSSTSGRKIGRKYHIRLNKGKDGLGFSITTRDNPTAADLSPIFVKNISPIGSALKDGRLRSGDRLLQVNGIDMAGKSHSEAVNILRNISTGNNVDLIIGRVEPELPSPYAPRPIPSEKVGSGNGVDIGEQDREVSNFRIALNDTGSAGLGVSVKGKTYSGFENTDLGIFVKSVMHGGAASKDGRLQPNDQLISVNGIPLLGLSNAEAMETLRREMVRCEGPDSHPEAIALTIARPMIKLGSGGAAWSNSMVKPGNASSSTSSTDSFASLDSDEQFICHYSKTAKEMKIGEESEREEKEKETAQNEREDRLGHACHRNVNSDDGESITQSISNKANNRWSVDDRDDHQEKVEEGRETDKHEPKQSHNAPHTNIHDESCSNGPENGDQLNLNLSSSSLSHQGSSKDDQDDHSNEEGNFQRKGFGRQSISEKRHATLDAKTLETYKRNRLTGESPHDSNEEEEKSKTLSLQKSFLHQTGNNQQASTLHPCTKSLMIKSASILSSPVGPTLGLRKSSSYETLQNLINKMKKGESVGDPISALFGPTTAVTADSRRAATLKLVRQRTLAEVPCNHHQKTQFHHLPTAIQNYANGQTPNQVNKSLVNQITPTCTRLPMASRENSRNVLENDAKTCESNKKKTPQSGRKAMIKSWFKLSGKKDKSKSNGKVESSVRKEKTENHMISFLERLKTKSGSSVGDQSDGLGSDKKILSSINPNSSSEQNTVSPSIIVVQPSEFRPNGLHVVDASEYEAICGRKCWRSVPVDVPNGEVIYERIMKDSSIKLKNSNAQGNEAINRIAVSEGTTREVIERPGDRTAITDSTKYEHYLNQCDIPMSDYKVNHHVKVTNHPTLNVQSQHQLLYNQANPKILNGFLNPSSSSSPALQVPNSSSSSPSNGLYSKNSGSNVNNAPTGGPYPRFHLVPSSLIRDSRTLERRIPYNDVIHNRTGFRQGIIKISDPSAMAMEARPNMNSAHSSGLHCSLSSGNLHYANQNGLESSNNCNIVPTNRAISYGYSENPMPTMPIIYSGQQPTSLHRMYDGSQFNSYYYGQYTASLAVGHNHPHLYPNHSNLKNHHVIAYPYKNTNNHDANFIKDLASSSTIQI